MVADGGRTPVNPASAEEAWHGLGSPTPGGVLIVGDHASAFVPPDIDLGIDPALLRLHIGSDIGVAEVAAALVNSHGMECAFLAGVSRLVVDLNRDDGASGLIPTHSDGHAIPGNIALDEAGKAARIGRFYHPYHAKLDQLVTLARPVMILSLHSFTPGLASRPNDERPWHIGILYNNDDRLARIAIPAFTASGLHVGDQLPYSGKDLNYSMNTHAEANGIPYLGIEMRQDMVGDAHGVERMAIWIASVLTSCRKHLAEMATCGE